MSETDHTEAVVEMMTAGIELRQLMLILNGEPWAEAVEGLASAVERMSKDDLRMLLFSAVIALWSRGVEPDPS